MAIPGNQQIAAWVIAARDGDSAAFAELVHQFQDAVAGVVIARLGRAPDAEDIMQESFLVAYERLADLREPPGFGPWVCGIARNLTLRFLRDRRRRAEVPADMVAPSVGPAAEEPGDVLEAVRRLPGRLGEPVTLFYINGYSTREVADLLNVPPGTVRRRLHEARKHLRTYMEKTMADEIRRSAPEPEFAEKVMRFTRFAEGARTAMTLANRAAERLGHDHIGCGHLLIGLLEEGTTTEIFRDLGVDADRVAPELEKLMEAGPGAPAPGKLPQKPRAKKVIDDAIDEARARDHCAVDVEHLVLGLIRQPPEPIGRVLADLGLKIDVLRKEINRRLDAKGAPAGRTPAGPRIRHTEEARDADSNPVLSLMRREIPEVAAGTLQIKRIAREPGLRTKVAVESVDPDVDAIEACIGPAGERMGRVSEALGGEKVDVVCWHSSVERLVANALLPADVGEIIPCPALQMVTVVVSAEELSRAIGDEGGNVRSAARLVGWDLDLVTGPEAEAQWTTLTQAVEHTLGSPAQHLRKLRELGVVSSSTAVAFGKAPLAKALGIEEPLAERLVDRCQEMARE